MIAQKAGKQTTGYFVGYTAKRQPVGTHELQQSCHSLNLLRSQISDDKPLRNVARVTNRILSDLEMKGILRPAPEEFNLSMNMEEQDSTAAEFIRTFRPTQFCGKEMFMALEREQRKAPDATWTSMMRLPAVKVTNNSHVGSPPWTELYGFRSQNEQFVPFVAV